MENAHIEDIVRLGRRISVGDAIARMASINLAVPDRTVAARDTTTTASSADSTGSCGANACEKPVSNSTFTLPIILGVFIPVVGAAILFIILQRRHVKKQREEDANDRHASMDFGLGDVPRTSRVKRAPSAMSERDFGEKGGMGGMSRRQVSMDMNLTSPYLLPPELQNSRESLHSLSRTIHQQEDPYRPVIEQYHPGDGASIRSQNKGSSIYTASSMPSKLNETASANLLENAGQMPRSNPPSSEFVRPPRQNSLPQSTASISPIESVPPPYPVEPPQAHLPVPALTPSSPERKGLPISPRPGQNLAPAPRAVEESQNGSPSNGNAANFRQSNDYLATMIMEKEPALPPATLERPNRKTPPAINTLPSNPRPARKESLPQPPNQGDGQSDYGDAFKVTPPSPGRVQMRGQRYSMDVPPEQFVQAGLGAPGFDAKRLSMGFRPLPPDAVTESDDPEMRANRIRSFYKEYFDDSKPAPAGQYYEDYDENYLGDATYFDPDTSAFVMPYAQPVTRRAMTPPPMGAPRFPGPPRGRNGSMGAMSAGGGRGMRGPPGPRAYSSASGRMPRPGPKRPMPPPAPLNSLPTPSKLRDDSFALMGSIEFAPPQTYRDRVAGRSESPFGERRLYSPAVPAFAPVVSAFDELAPIPSPHMLRKSGTFTSLDFAPPKKFRDPDSMSDAGSIRSARSGISQAQLGAIRNGAYRVSRLPNDVVFTKDDLASSLKPQWGMRAGS